MNTSRATALVAATTLMGTLAVVAAPTATAATATVQCEELSTKEIAVDPTTGKNEQATVTDCHDNAPTTVASEPVSGTHRPAAGTGGLIIRNSSGHDLGSGIGEGQTFRILNSGPGGLVKVEQVSRGTGGGWGAQYTGYVLSQYAVPA